MTLYFHENIFLTALLVLTLPEKIHRMAGDANNLFMKVSLLLKLMALIAAFSAPITPVMQAASQQRSGEVGQSRPRALRQDKQITEVLSAGETHSYAVALTAKQYLKVSVEQTEIDVILIVYNPLSEVLVEEDSQSSKSDIENVELVAETEGTYTIAVQATEEGDVKGKYTISIVESRRATEKELVLQHARNLHRESLKNYEMGRYIKAIQLGEQALEILEKEQNRDSLDVANVLNDLGLFYKDNNDFLKSEAALQRSLSIEERLLGENHPDTAGTYNNLAELNRAKGEYTKAEPYYKRALKVAESVLGPRHPHTGTALNNLALLYVESGDYTKSEQLYLRSGAIYEQALGSKHPNFAQSLNNLADYYYYKGEYSKAEPLYRRALVIREKALGPVHPAIVESLAGLARLYQDKGDYQSAEPLLRRALAISEKALGNVHLGLAYSLNNLAELYKARGDYTAAEPYYKRSLGIAERVLGSKHPNVAVPLNNLALLSEQKGDYVHAEKLFHRSLDIIERSLGTEHPHFAQALNNLGRLNFKQGEYAKALSLYQRALLIRKKVLGPSHPDVAKTLSNLALLYLSKGNTAKSLHLLEAAIKISEQHLSLNLYAGSERQKRLYIATLANEVNNAISLQIQLAPKNLPARRLALLTILQRKGRTLDIMADAAGALRQQLSPESRTLLDQLTFTRTQFASLMFKGPQFNDYSNYRLKIETLGRDIDELEAKISGYKAEARRVRTLTTIESMQAIIPPNSALIEFILYRPLLRNKLNSNNPYGEPRYAAYILFDEGEPAYVELGNAKTINSSIISLQGVLRDPRYSESEVRQRSQTVYRAIIKPLERLLGSRRALLLSPDGALNLIPFGALVDDHECYFMERYGLTYLTSGRDLLRLRTYPPSSQGAVLFANPQFDLHAPVTPAGGTASTYKASPNIYIGHFNQLEGTTQEVEALKILLGEAEVLSEARATETALKRVSKPRILHVATHGFFLSDSAQYLSTRKSSLSSGDPLQFPVAMLGGNAMLLSGIVMAGANELQGGDGEDGIVTALEMSGLDLWGTRLVVLSACDTGLGVLHEGEGVYGLRRALVLAGAESQVMSLWKVDDEVMRDIMIDWYRRIIAGESRGEALRQVQLEILRSKEYRHPYFWASLIISGDWRSLEFQ